MKANITIKIGCEAGSKYCGECNFVTVEYAKYCLIFNKVLDPKISGSSKLNRCQPCLASEQAVKIQESKVKDLEDILHGQKVRGYFEGQVGWREKLNVILNQYANDEGEMRQELNLTERLESLLKEEG